MSVKEDIMGIKAAKPAIPPVDSSLKGAPQGGMSAESPKQQAAGAGAAPDFEKASTLTGKQVQDKRAKIENANGVAAGADSNERTPMSPYLQGQLSDANAKIGAQQKADEEANRVERFRQFVTNGGMTDEQKAAEEKRRKREQLWNSIGDGVSALSNLYFTTKGAPARRIDPRTTLSARTQELYDKIDAERKSDEQQMLNAYIKQQGADSKAAVDRARENYYGTLGVNAGEDQKNKNKESEAKVAGINATTGLTGQRTKTEEYNTGVAKAKADNQDALIKSQAGANNARAAASMASAANSYAHAANAGNKTGGTIKGGGSGGTGGYTIKLKDGKVYNYGKEKTGALTSLAPTMSRKARVAAEKYMKSGDMKASHHYKQLADDLDKTKSAAGLHALVAANAWDFPSMDADVRNATGIGGANTRASRKVTPKQNKQIKIQKGW